MSYVDVRHFGKLMFRYDPARHLIEIKPRGEPKAIIDLSQVKNDVMIVAEGKPDVNQFLSWKRTFDTTFSAPFPQVLGVGRFPDGRKFAVILPLAQSFIDDAGDEILEQMIRKEIEAMTPDMCIEPEPRDDDDDDD